MLNWLLPFGQSLIRNSVEGLAGRAFKNQTGWSRKDDFVSREHFVGGVAARLAFWTDSNAVRQDTSQDVQGKRRPEKQPT